MTYAVDQLLPVDVKADDASVRRVGRFDASEPGAMRFAWSACSMSLRFSGSAINVRLGGNGANRYEVIIDGERGTVLAPQKGTHWYRLATDLTAGEHHVTVFKRTEAFFGVDTFGGFQLSEGGKPIAPEPAARRRIEVIGDSISAGYGIEGASQNDHFSAETENAYLTYGAIAARAFDADFVDIAWSGRTLWPKNTVPEIYDRILPDKSDSKWDFSGEKPQVILINLGTNDVANGNPEEEGWVGAYLKLVERLRKNDPQATIYLATGPMITDQFSKSKTALTTIRRYLERVIDERHKAGDDAVHLLQFATQTGKEGFGADWHPNRKTHQIMSAKLIETIAHDLHWEPAPVKESAKPGDPKK